MTDIHIKRRVFYLSGFDPRGAGHYHRVYREHSAAQSKIHGTRFAVSGRKRAGAHVQQWRVRSTRGRAQADVQMQFLCWDDIIRRQWSTRPWRVLGDLWFCVRVYLLSGLIVRFGKASRHQVITGLYPPVFLLLATIAAAAVGVTGYVLAQGLIVTEPWASIAGTLLAAGAGALVLRGAWRLGKRAAAFWLLRIYAFSARWARGELPELETRIDAFADRIAAALVEAEPDEEVLVVAHSVGTMLAVSVLARALRDPRLSELTPGRLVLMTLGECIPLLSFQQGAGRYREELQALANDERLLWIDYTAPTDGACFPLLDFVRASGLTVAPGRSPKLLSPRFFKLYTPERYRKLRRDWYTMHFLYLMSTDLPGDYDYFAITAGPQPLHARYAGA